jgi:hypothetical protein
MPRCLTGIGGEGGVVVRVPGDGAGRELLPVEVDAGGEREAGADRRDGAILGGRADGEVLDREAKAGGAELVAAGCAFDHGVEPHASTRADWHSARVVEVSVQIEAGRERGAAVRELVDHTASIGWMWRVNRVGGGDQRQHRRSPSVILWKPFLAVGRTLFW